MVDLAKIRKKAKRAKEDAPGDAPAAAPPPEPVPPSAEAAAPAAAPRSGPAGVVEAAAPVPGSVGVPPPAGPAPTKLEKFREQAGRRREAEAVSADAEVEADSSRIELLTFAIAGEQYAVDIERIVEIVTPRPLTRIPNADTSVVGIISLRGTIVTLVDVRRKLRHPPAGEPTPDTRIVVVDFKNETVGFVVDRVLRVVKTTAADVEPHPVVHATELDESIRGVFRIAGALTILLDLDKLLDHRALAVATP